MGVQRIAVIGGGIAGLSATWLLRQRYDVRLFERNGYVGGHSNTLDAPVGAASVAVDTGFMVFNHRNYPHLTQLFRHLGIATQPTEMSFSVSVDDGALEYAGTHLGTLFAQRRNLFSIAHWGMLRDIVRFNHAAKRLARGDENEALTLAEYLDSQALGPAFRHRYLLPMAAAIWSCPAARMLEFPAVTLARFFNNHGLLDLVGRPRWHTVRGGSRTYVERMLSVLRDRVTTDDPVTSVSRSEGGVIVRRASGRDSHFDHAVLACHADEALALIDNPTVLEATLLDAFRYQSNRTFLHADEALMPANRRAWASWNYLACSRANGANAVSVTYWMNRLQNLPPEKNLFVSLNPLREPRPGTVLAQMTYDHPVFDEHAVIAQRNLEEIQGVDRLWFCGSYCGNGFHEDALASSLRVAEALGVKAPWAPRPEARQPLYGNDRPSVAEASAP